MATPTDLEEELVAIALRAHGVRVLALPREPREDPAEPALDLPDLSIGLARTSSPLLRSTLPLVLIEHPDASEAVREASRELAPDHAQAFQTLYTAAV